MPHQFTDETEHTSLSFSIAEYLLNTQRMLLQLLCSRRRVSHREYANRICNNTSTIDGDTTTIDRNFWKCAQEQRRIWDRILLRIFLFFQRLIESFSCSKCFGGFNFVRFAATDTTFIFNLLADDADKYGVDSRLTDWHLRCQRMQTVQCTLYTEKSRWFERFLEISFEKRNEKKKCLEHSGSFSCGHTCSLKTVENSCQITL